MLMVDQNLFLFVEKILKKQTNPFTGFEFMVTTW